MQQRIAAAHRSSASQQRIAAAQCSPTVTAAAAGMMANGAPCVNTAARVKLKLRARTAVWTASDQLQRVHRVARAIDHIDHPPHWLALPNDAALVRDARSLASLPPCGRQRLRRRTAIAVAPGTLIAVDDILFIHTIVVGRGAVASLTSGDTVVVSPLRSAASRRESRQAAHDARGCRARAIRVCGCAWLWRWLDTSVR